MNPEYLSGEASASPAVEPLLAGAHRLAARGFGAGSLSARNGPRVTTHANVPLELLSSQDFIEVADYDPHLDRLLCIGKREPHPHAPLHQLVMRAKKEVGGIVIVDAPEAAAKLTAAKKGRTSLENALGILEALRGQDAAAWGTHVVVPGRSPEEALARAEALLASPVV